MTGPSERLAAVLSLCEQFWKPGGTGGTEGPVPGGTCSNTAFHDLVSDLIRQEMQLERERRHSGEPRRIEDYLAEYSDADLDEPRILELIEYEFVLRFQDGRRPDVSDYVRRFPHFQGALRERLMHLQEELMTHTSIDSGASNPQDGSQSADAAPPASARSDPAWLAEILRNVRPFTDLSQQLREAVAAHATLREFSPGDVLLKQGEPADSLLILLEGRADVRLDDSGRTHSIASVEPHTVVGELGLLAHEVRTATVTARTRGCAAVLDKEAFERLAARDPRLSIALAELIAERVGTLAIDVLCGKTIGPYLIRQRLGRGASGIVYAAADTHSGRPVALKMLRHDLAFDRHASQRFHREAEIIRGLEHPNIIRVFDEFSAYGTSFIAMELCDGPSLSELIARFSPLPVQVVRAVIGQLAAGLSFAHDAGITHRDLKPSNVLFSRDGTARIADFGLARLVWTEEPGTTAFGQIVGTPRYMAPEQLSGERGDPRSDLYALGCILYEMLAARPMFVAKRFSELLLERAAWEVPPADQIRTGLDQELYDLLQALVEREPGSRRADLKQLAGWAAPVDLREIGFCDPPRVPLEWSGSPGDSAAAGGAHPEQHCGGKLCRPPA